MAAILGGAFGNLIDRVFYDGKVVDFIDFGIGEQTMLGAAAGLALRGRKPVAHALATFITLRAYEFARTDIGIPGFPVKLVGGVPGFLSEANGPTHQAVEDVAIMRSIPPMNVFCPADNEDMLIGLEQILLDDAPYYIRFNPAAPVVKHSNMFTPGIAEQFGEGTDIAILTYGFMFGESYKAMQALEEMGISCRLLNLRTVKPIDEQKVLAAVNECTLAVTVEDHFQTGGLYSVLAETLIERGIGGNVLPIALKNRWFKPALLKNVLEYEGFSAQKLVATISAALVNKKVPKELYSLT
mgnify:CR=1 FL=1